MNSIIPFLKTLFPPALQSCVHLVGGTVRDMLLHQECKDIDLVAVISAAELSGLGFKRVEATSGATIYFKHHPEFGKIEVTRLENNDQLRDDLIRRDFTVNALAMNLNGELIDLLNAKADLQTGTLRPCSDHTFTADPLRLFRAFRFAADGWNMTGDMAALIRKRDWTEMYAAIPVERFSNEMLKAFEGRNPERFFQLMIEFSVGAEFLPEIFRMSTIPAGPVEHHPEGDLFTHSVQVLQRTAESGGSPLTRFCAFFHDLGKLATDPAHYPKHHGHDHAGFNIAIDFCTRLCLSAAHRKALAWTSTLHGKANLWESLRDATKITMAEQAIKGGIVEILPAVAVADKAGGLPMAGWSDAVRVAGMNTRELGIDQERLEVISAMNRPSYILQKRVDVLRELRSTPALSA